MHNEGKVDGTRAVSVTRKYELTRLPCGQSQVLVDGTVSPRTSGACIAATRNIASWDAEHQAPIRWLHVCRKSFMCGCWTFSIGREPVHARAASYGVVSMNSKTAPPTFAIGVMSDCMGPVHLLRRSGQHSTVAPRVFTSGPCCLDRFCRGDRKKDYTSSRTNSMGVDQLHWTKRSAGPLRDSLPAQGLPRDEWRMDELSAPLPARPMRTLTSTNSFISHGARPSEFGHGFRSPPHLAPMEALSHRAPSSGLWRAANSFLRNQINLSG